LFASDAPHFRASKSLDHRIVDLDRDTLLDKLDLQHELLTSFVLHDLAAKSSQRTADDSSGASGLQTFITSEWLSGLNQPMDFPQFVFDSVLVVDSQRADDCFGLERSLQILIVYYGENVARKEDEMRTDEPPLVPLPTYDLRQEVGDIATTETARHDFLGARTHLVGTPSIGNTGLDAELKEVFGPDSGLLVKHRHGKTPLAFCVS
jgi:hypothetical protein